MGDGSVPQPGAARLKRSAGPDEWLEAAKRCKYLSEHHMKQLCEMVKEYMMEESNIQPVSTPVTICGDIHGQFYDLLELFRVAGGMPDATHAEEPVSQGAGTVITSDDIEPPSSISDPKLKKRIRQSSSGSRDIDDEDHDEDGGSDTKVQQQPQQQKTSSTEGVSGGLLSGNFIFLGDYVDRGYFSLETLTLLLCLKVKYPNRVTLVRGNHESRQITQVYGFYEECKQKYGNAAVWKACCQVFDYMTLGAIVDGRVLCVHGGLSPEIRTLDQVRIVARAQEIPHEGAFCDLVWSDPDDEPDTTWAVSPRGAGWMFGAKVVDEFCHVNNLSLIARAHQLVNEGYKWHFDGASTASYPENDGGQLDVDHQQQEQGQQHQQHRSNMVTVWSAPNYCYRCANMASVCELREDLRPSFKLFAAVPAESRYVPQTKPARSEYFL